MVLGGQSGAGQFAWFDFSRDIEPLAGSRKIDGKTAGKSVTQKRGSALTNISINHDRGKKKPPPEAQKKLEVVYSLSENRSLPTSN